MPWLELTDLLSAAVVKSIDHIEPSPVLLAAQREPLAEAVVRLWVVTVVAYVGQLLEATHFLG